VTNGNIYALIICNLNKKLIDLVADSVDLALKLVLLSSENGAGDDRARDTTGTTQSSTRGNEDIRNVLILADEGKMEKDSERISITSKNNQLGDTTVEGLGTLVSTLLDLLVVVSLLDKLKNGGGESRISKREDLAVSGLNNSGLLLLFFLFLLLFLLLL
jgi:hypothetical protein